MSRVLLRKLIGLGRDEDGAALVITLALLMFMYLTCAGVFAIGQSVKDRIHLQNACDAAAYSAAVVQADTLSRIATINKAMSWTYVSMTRRQMDHIVYRWLDHVAQHYKDDRADARKWYENGTRCYKHSGWDISAISLNGDSPIPVELIELANDLFAPYKASQADSFYATSLALAGQIACDKANIVEMNAALTDLGAALPQREVSAAKAVLKANVSMDDLANSRWLIDHSPNVIAGREYKNSAIGGGYLRDLHSEETEENLFVSYSTDTGTRTAFDRGTGFQRNANHFFSYGNGSSDTSGSVGIQRAYRRTGGASDKLYAEWTWWSTKSVCPIPFHVPPGIPYATGCGHSCHSDCSCGQGVKTQDSVFLSTMAAKIGGGCVVVPRCVRIHGDIQAVYDSATYVGERARPLVLRPSYFGSSGTITIGLAKYNENPWYRVFGDAAAAVAGAGDKLGGIFAAFNPHKSVEWTWALSSAKAGYRYKNEEYDEDPNHPKRAYRVDWKDGNQSWNLCVSDWDAVFVPVRSARMKAENGSWTEESGNEDFLREWIEDGNWQPLDGSARHDYAVAGKMPTLPQMHKSGSGLDWKRLADLLYH